MSDPPPTAEALGAELRRHFGFSGFRTGQAEAVQDVLAGHDLLLVMPTGSGKSLCFQLASLMLPGVTIVVSPLIALMKDQVDGLAKHGIAATCLNSSLSMGEMAARLHDLRAGRFKLVYVAPERFRNARFREALEPIDVSLFTVDEAHCISQWGHDFRPDYLNLREVLLTLPRARVLAVTATATPSVRTDIVRQLGLGVAPRPAPKIRVHGFARPNLHLAVGRAPSHDIKFKRTLQIAEAFRRGIVYCSTRKMTERVALRLRSAGLKPLLYHGALADEARAQAQDRFMAETDPIVVATNAFGMGVDRKDLRFVVHWDVPGSIEAYYQEVGRAGRDGGLAWCELLFNYADVRTQRFFLEGSAPAAAEVLRVWAAVQRLCAQQPAVLTGEAWAEAAGVKNELAVRAALGLLERAGMLTKTAEPGSRTPAIALIAQADPAQLKPHLDGLQVKRRLDEERLEALLAFVDYRSCRHAFLLNYFGEGGGLAQRCAVCDRCVKRPLHSRRSPTEAQWLTIQKVLSCIGRMQGGRHNASRVIQVLLGEPDAALTELGLDALSTFGLLANETPTGLAALIGALRDACCIQSATAGSEAPLSLTPYGLEVVQRRCAFELAWPSHDDVASSPLSPSAAAPIPPLAARRRSAGRSGQLAPASGALLTSLEEWRTREATRLHQQTFRILPNRTLEAIAQMRPRNYDALLTVPGIGPIKLSRYGAAILQLVQAAEACPPEGVS